MSLSFVMSDSHVIPAVAIVAASFVGFVWLAVAKGWLYPLFAGIGYLAVALVWADVVSALHDPNSAWVF